MSATDRAAKQDMTEPDWERMLSYVEERYWDYPIPTSLALTEVVRLRQAMTQLRDDYLAHIAGYDEATVTHMCYSTAADDLTRILNGDTDD